MKAELCMGGNMKWLVGIIMSVSFSASSLGSDSDPTSLEGIDLQIISSNTPRVYIYGAPIINSGCEKSDNPVLLLGGSDANTLGKELYSALLMAKASGKEVVLQSDHCWAEHSKPVLTSMYIKD